MRRLAIALIACAGGALPAFAQAPPAAAPAPGAQASGGMFTNNGPIDVSADSQERIDPTHIRLTGSVEVVQGQARLRSPQIDLFYPPRGQPAAGEHAATSGGALGKIERAEAEGPVYYVTPTETAKGDHGTYLAADDSITLTGNVVLTQGKNVSTGDKVVMHQKTGQAVLTAGQKGRTRAVIYPNEPAPAPGQPAAPGKPAQPAPAPARAAPRR
ncbi:MAG: OstA family protein [Caulobacteraceae bacterium]|nr:OstA family protein [Caulobacter sp.]